MSSNNTGHDAGHDADSRGESARLGSADTDAMRVSKRPGGIGMTVSKGGRTIDLDWTEVRELHRQLTVRLFRH